MRLLHSTELRFQEFYDQNIPLYAILSHRWGEDEVSFQEMQFLLLSPEDRARVLTPALLDVEAKIQRQGYRKVVDFCRFAAARGHAWVWVDTVCIDKASSAELSEAINSMWKCYQDSSTCYAYLFDVSCQDPSMLEREFRRSEWFKRGWTLQELIAPAQVEFLDCEWNSIGDKTTRSEAIQKICGIPQSCLNREKSLDSFTIAMRMSWARKRATSRREDEAYCLIGLFSVHMPLLYGEGHRAFSRLCEEILKTSNDDSILLHRRPWLLPASPRDFAESNQYAALDYMPSSPEVESSYVVTKGWLHLQNAPVGSYPSRLNHLKGHKMRYVKLNCHHRDGRRPATIVITRNEEEGAFGCSKLYAGGFAAHVSDALLLQFREFETTSDKVDPESGEKRIALYIQL